MSKKKGRVNIALKLKDGSETMVEVDCYYDPSILGLVVSKAHELIDGDISKGLKVIHPIRWHVTHISSGKFVLPWQVNCKTALSAIKDLIYLRD